MPDVERPENRVHLLTRGRLLHRDQLFWTIFRAHPSFQQLHVFKFDKNAVHSFNVQLNSRLEGRLRFDTSDDVHVRTFAFAESAKAFDLRVCF